MGHETKQESCRDNIITLTHCDGRLPMCLHKLVRAEFITIIKKIDSKVQSMFRQTYAGLVDFKIQVQNYFEIMEYLSDVIIIYKFIITLIKNKLHMYTNVLLMN